jgi:hypothetical protein
LEGLGCKVASRACSNDRDLELQHSCPQ